MGCPETHLTRFVAICALLRWSGIGPAISLRLEPITSCWKKDTEQVIKSSKRCLFSYNESDMVDQETGTQICRFGGKNLTSLPAKSCISSEIWEEHSSAGDWRVNGEFGFEASQEDLT